MFHSFFLHLRVAAHLDNLDREEEGDWEGGHDEEDGADGEQDCTDTRTLLTGCTREITMTCKTRRELWMQFILSIEP